MGTGIILGVLTAFLQAGSYLCSANFNAKHKSPWHLLIFSQLAMGVISLSLLPFFFPVTLLAKWQTLLWLLLLWGVLFFLGQLGLFLAQTQIPTSCLGSLLGLKLLVLAAIWILALRQHLNYLQILGIALATAAALLINKGGGFKITLRGWLYLLMTLVFYCLADILETNLTLMVGSGNAVLDGVAMALICYSFGGIIMVPVLAFVKWNWSEQKSALPFGIAWLLSQMTLLGCFALLNPLFGNVIVSMRGVLSLLLGALVCKLGFTQLDAPADKKVWLRRAAGALLMIGGVIAYNMGSR